MGVISPNALSVSGLSFKLAYSNRSITAEMAIEMAIAISITLVSVAT
jgi:hypothetical protein